MALGAIACGAIYLVLAPVLNSKPIIKRTESAPSRSLAYEQKIARSGQSAPAGDEVKPDGQAAAPADADQAAPAPETQAAEPAQGAANAAPEHDMAALPHEGAPADEPDALPWQQHAARPDDRAAPGMNPGGDDPRAGQPGQYDDQSDPMAALPGENDDPNAWPAGPQEEPQEWVQVLVSGAGMHGTPGEDSPALFAFPYGRTLRVVSRYEGWVEVTDPQSAATGWMKAQYLAPTNPPGVRQEQNAEQTYDDEDMPRWKRRWLRRHGGGLGDLIGRAIEGDF